MENPIWLPSSKLCSYQEQLDKFEKDFLHKQQEKEKSIDLSKDLSPTPTPENPARSRKSKKAVSDKEPIDDNGPNSVLIPFQDDLEESDS